MEQSSREKSHKLDFEQSPTDFPGEEFPEEMLECADTGGVQHALVQAGVRGPIEINVAYLDSIVNLEAQIKHYSKILELAKLGNYRPPPLEHGADFHDEDWEKVAQDTLAKLSSECQRPLLPGDPPMVERTEFPRFLELDENIRLLIWAYALSGPRRHHFNANHKFMNPVPALLHVNRESRQLALQVFTLCDNTYIDLERDQVFCTSYKWDSFLEARNICVTQDDLMESTSPEFLSSKFKFLKSITWFSCATFMSTILTPAREHFVIRINPVHEDSTSYYDLIAVLRILLLFESAFGRGDLSEIPILYGNGLDGEDWKMNVLKDSDYNDWDTIYQRCRLKKSVQPSPMRRLEPSVRTALNSMSPQIRSKLRYTKEEKKASNLSIRSRFR